MGFIESRGSMHDTSKVKIIHLSGTDDERTTEVRAMIQSKSGFFNVDTPIFVGDVVEVPDPRLEPGGVERRLAQVVDVNNFGSLHMQHIEVTWGKAPPARVAVVRRLTFENLHEHVQAAAGELFADGHFASAVSEAFKSIEVRVRKLTGLDRSGAKLMGDAFGTESPIIDIAKESGQTGKDEREGFLALFRGAAIGIRNPKAHELFKPEDPQQALEYLGFASLLHRRIDGAAVQTRD